MKTKKEISVEKMVEFINANSEFIPARSVEKFKTFDIEKQYHKMQWYIKSNQMKNEMKDKNVLAVRVQRMFDAKNASVEDAQAVIEFCNGYIEEMKQKTLSDIEKEIERLMQLKETLK